MTHPPTPQEVGAAFAARAAELQERLRDVLAERKVAERDVARAKEAVQGAEARLSAVCSQEGQLRRKVADVQRALREARKLAP